MYLFQICISLCIEIANTSVITHPHIHYFLNIFKVCKYFLEAIDKALYGWFWSCPNGNKCIYRHALPPGFVLKKKEQKNKEKDEISLEELIEEERGKLGTNLTKITLETFTTWKKKKVIGKRFSFTFY